MILDIFSFTHHIDIGHTLDWLNYIGQITPPINPDAGSPGFIPDIPGADTVVAECLSTFGSGDNFALSCGEKVSTEQAANWDAMWDAKIGTASHEFVAMLNISRYIAGPAIGYWFVYAIIKLWRNGFTEVWTDLLPVVLLAFLLYTNNAELPRRSTLALRALMNYQNTVVIDSAKVSQNIEEKFKEIVDFDVTQTAIIEARSQCNGETRNSQMLECLEDAKQLTDLYISEYKAEHPGAESPKFAERLTNFTETVIENPISKLREILSAEISGDDVEKFLIGRVANPLVSLATEGWMAMLNQLFQYIVELSWMYTAIILPIPLAFAFYPGTRGLLISWLVGFVTIGFFKLNLNISTSLVVWMLYNRGPGEPLFDVMLLGLGVLIMAFGMTAMGGMAIMAGVSTVASGLTLGVLNFAVGKSYKSSR